MLVADEVWALSLIVIGLCLGIDILLPNKTAAALMRERLQQNIPHGLRRCCTFFEAFSFVLGKHAKMKCSNPICFSSSTNWITLYTSNTSVK